MLDGMYPIGIQMNEYLVVIHINENGPRQKSRMNHVMLQLGIVQIGLL